VFSSRFIDAERARDQLMARLDGPALGEPRLLRITTGRRERFWVHNVVAIGLSSGFLEPLESTAIYLIQDGIARLMSQLTATRPLNESDLALFNEGSARRFARIRDFIILHYCLTRRRDSELWRHVATMELPETLAFGWSCGAAMACCTSTTKRADATSGWPSMPAWPIGQSARHPVFAEIRKSGSRALQARRDGIAAQVERMPAHHRTLQAMLR
jgi:tryptophan halogenase